MCKAYFIIAITEDEEYRPIIHERIRQGYYEISNYGNIRRCKDHKLLRPHRDKDGYLRIELVGNKGSDAHKHYVHRLVANEFIGTPPSVNHIVNHKNSNRSFNYDKNLEWVTPKENTLHGETFGNIDHNPLKGYRKYDDDTISQFTSDIKNGMTNSEILDSLGLTGRCRKNINSLLNDIRYKKCYKDIYEMD